MLKQHHNYVAYVFLSNAQTLQNLTRGQYYKSQHDFLHVPRRCLNVSQSIQNICKYKLSFTNIFQSVSVTNKNCSVLLQISVKIWLLIFWTSRLWKMGRLHLKCDGTCAETRFRLPAKWKSPFKLAGGRQFSWLLAAEVCASVVVTLDTPCSKVVRRVLAIYPICQFPLHFPSCASPCAITFQLESTNILKDGGSMLLKFGTHVPDYKAS